MDIASLWRAGKGHWKEKPMLKKFSLIILVLFLLAGCTLPAPSVGPESESGSPTATLDQPAGDEPQPSALTSTPAGDQEAEADKPGPSPTSPPAATSTEPLPTATSAEAGGGVEVAAATATTVQATAVPSKTPFPVSAFDPRSAYGNPKYENKMVVANFNEWAPPETGTLPDNTNIRLEFKDGKLYVTGKQLLFSTWWFSYHSQEDSYVEMTFDTETCSGSDAYGMILRGPEHKAGVSYGYVISFTCDGRLWVFRLDGTNPWATQELVDETRSDYINAGSDKLNVIGVRADGDTLTIVANGYQIAQVKDNKYSKGRIGVFVRPANTNNYTYRLTNFAYWELDTDE
jgi:hypothetical protein